MLGSQIKTGIKNISDIELKEEGGILSVKNLIVPELAIFFRELYKKNPNKIRLSISKNNFYLYDKKEENISIFFHTGIMDIDIKMFKLTIITSSSIKVEPKNYIIGITSVDNMPKLKLEYNTMEYIITKIKGKKFSDEYYTNVEIYINKLIKNIECIPIIPESDTILESTLLNAFKYNSINCIDNNRLKDLYSKERAAYFNTKIDNRLILNNGSLLVPYWSIIEDSNIKELNFLLEYYKKLNYTNSKEADNNYLDKEKYLKDAVMKLLLQIKYQG